MDLTLLKKSDIRWQVNQPEHIKPRPMAPVVTDDVTVATWRCSSRDRRYYWESVAVGFDPLSGEERWRINDKTLFSGPKATPHGILIGSMFGDLRMVDPLTGVPKWQRQLPDESQSLGWVYGDGIVVAVGDHSDNRLWAYDAESGNPVWQGESEGAPQRLSVHGNALLHLENVDDEAVAVCRALATGEQLWRRALAGWPYGIGAIKTPDPVVLATTRVACWTLSLADGAQIARLDWPNGVSDVELGPRDGALIIGQARPWESQSALLMLDVTDPSAPQVQWSAMEKAPSCGGVFLGAEHLLSQTEAGRVSVRSRESGEEVAMWNPKTKKGEYGGFAARDELLYCTIGDTLFCVEPPH